MDVVEASLGKVLAGTNQYLVPLYQRPYSWTNRNWETIWQDILELAETARSSPGASHFTGTLVLEASSVTSGLTRFLVVDGQQRLTTLSLLLAAITQEWESRGDAAAARRVRDQFLLNPFAEEVDSQYRLRPANFDEPFFRAVLQGQSPKGTESKVSRACGFFKGKIRRLDETGLELEEVEQATLSGLKFVSITAKSDDNVYRIFESINNTGVRLTQADLVRNFVFMKLGEAGNNVYENIWRPLVEGLESDDVETVFWIDAQWRDPEARKLDVYEQQKRHLKPMDNEALVAYLQNVLLIAGAIRQLRGVSPIEDKALDSMVGRFAQLKTPGALVVATRILYLHSTHEVSTSEAADAFRILESYLVRRVLAGVPVNSVGRISATVAAELKGSDVATSLHRLLSTGRRQYIPDDEVRRILVESPIYVRPRRENLKFVLQRLLENKQGKDSIDFGPMSIEHVLPQNLSEQARREFAASLDETDDVDVVHAAVVHTIGNLTLTNYNSELGNSPFSTKSQQRLQETGVIANQKIASNLSWGPDEINARSKELATDAIQIWPGPDESLLNKKQDTIFERIDAAVALVEEGSWTTYGDIAQAVGTVGQVVGQAISRTAAPDGAWRVLRAGGTVSPEFRWPENSPFTGQTCQEVLEAEGVSFSGSKAEPSQRMSASALMEALEDDIAETFRD